MLHEPCSTSVNLDTPQIEWAVGSGMNVPLVATFLYLTCGMVTTAVAWPTIWEEAELAMSIEEEEDFGILQVLLIIFCTLGWPIVLAELWRRQ